MNGVPTMPREDGPEILEQAARAIFEDADSFTAADPRQARSEERLNAITHGAATVLALFGLYVLLANSWAGGDALRLVGCAVFGVAMVLVYAASTIYHGVTDEALKARYRVVDQASIYLMIAGSYTPFTLTTLRGPWGWGLLAAVWSMAIVGIVARVFFVSRYAHVRALPYLAMGWLAVIAIRPILERVPPGGLALIVFGGLAYTFGVYFYVRDKVPYYHAVWHLFVMVGTMLHFWAVLLYTQIPAAV